MNGKVSNKKYIIISATGLLIILLILKVFSSRISKIDTVMGGKLCRQVSEDIYYKNVTDDKNVEKYFRPSNLKVLNNREFNTDFFDKNVNDKILNKYMISPEEAIINYYSILREAADVENGKGAGCGSIGNAYMPYPFAYDFLSSSYKKRVSLRQYINSFKNILHINLIKYKQVPGDEKHLSSMKYFYEIETIEDSDKYIGKFGYYYGYMFFLKENNIYKISDIEIYSENYLCAPYHGWAYIGEYVVDYKYGDWCSLVKERYPAMIDGYTKKIYFKGTDNNDYYIEFFTLTNDNDIEIAQYKKGLNGVWQHINIDTSKCVKK